MASSIASTFILIISRSDNSRSTCVSSRAFSSANFPFRAARRRPRAPAFLSLDAEPSSVRWCGKFYPQGVKTFQSVSPTIASPHEFLTSKLPPLCGFNAASARLVFAARRVTHRIYSSAFSPPVTNLESSSLTRFCISLTSSSCRVRSSARYSVRIVTARSRSFGSKVPTRETCDSQSIQDQLPLLSVPQRRAAIHRHGRVADHRRVSGQRRVPHGGFRRAEKALKSLPRCNSCLNLYSRNFPRNRQRSQSRAHRLIPAPPVLR